MNDLYITTTNEMRYKIIGEGPVVMLLHGWGQNLETFDNLVQGLEGKFILVDLMGFGMSDEPDYPRNVDDYVKDIEALVDELKIDKFTLLGHSFGGRISIIILKILFLLLLLRILFVTSILMVSIRFISSLVSF